MDHHARAVTFLMGGGLAILAGAAILAVAGAAVQWIALLAPLGSTTTATGVGVRYVLKMWQHFDTRTTALEDGHKELKDREDTRTIEAYNRGLDHRDLVDGRNVHVI